MVFLFSFYCLLVSFIVFYCLLGFRFRQIYRQIDRQTERKTDRQTDRYTDRQTERETDTKTDRQTDRQTYRQTDRETDKQTVRETDRQTDRQTDRPDRQTYREIDMFRIQWLGFRVQVFSGSFYCIFSDFQCFLGFLRFSVQVFYGFLWYFRVFQGFLGLFRVQGLDTQIDRQIDMFRVQWLLFMVQCFSGSFYCLFSDFQCFLGFLRFRVQVFQGFLWYFRVFQGFLGLFRVQGLDTQLDRQIDMFRVQWLLFRVQ